MNNVANDAQLHICEWLSVLNILELRRVNTMFLKIPVAFIFKQRLIQQIMRICYVGVFDAQNLITSCDINGGVISGSVILQTLIGEQWDSDVDIFVNTMSPTFKSKNFLISVIGAPSNIELIVMPEYTLMFDNDWSEHNPSIFTMFCSASYGSSDTDYEIIYNYKWQIINYSKYDRIQVIGTARDSSVSSHQAVTRHFDMSIVCNTFVNKTLEVLNLDTLLEKRGSIFRDTSNERIDKYIDRGFDVYVPQNVNIMDYRKGILELKRALCTIPVTSAEHNNWRD
jgi:hypothetical protein